ncbi:MAG: hypothetical protein LPK15_00005, partial [Alteromonadaceae bacterium]|nr:type VI secretion system tip protein VgrG [Marinobacter sp.]MDX5438816.1 hypothetical protein [Alteromonadaceae bacterium]
KQGKNQLVEAGTEIHHKAGMKIVIEAGAEVTLKAGGSFVKVDPSGVTISGPLVRMNSGGGPGRGRGQTVQVPERPGLVTAAGGVVAPVALAEVGQRSIGKIEETIELLELAAVEEFALVDKCMEQSDGSCPLRDCPCREAVG